MSTYDCLILYCPCIMPIVCKRDETSLSVRRLVVLSAVLRHCSSGKPPNAGSPQSVSLSVWGSQHKLFLYQTCMTHRLVHMSLIRHDKHGKYQWPAGSIIL